MKLKILQWNIWYKEDPRKIADEIIRIDPDIVCAQELMQNLKKDLDTPKIISEKIKYYYFYKEAVTWDSRFDITSQGNAIFSKFPIFDTEFEFLSDFEYNPANATKEGRVYVESKIRLGARLLGVGTTHLSYSFRFKNTPRRKKEADKLAEIIKNKKNKFILTGDLNNSPKSYVVNKILENKNLKNAGPDDSEMTWTTKPFDYHGFKEDNLKWRIDYVFVSNEINVLSSRIISTKVSDHLPILTEVEV